MSRPLTAILVTSCICQRTPFERVLPLAREEDWTLDDLVRETGCGAQCGLCLPYLRRMLQTGETVFRELLTS